MSSRSRQAPAQRTIQLVIWGISLRGVASTAVLAQLQRTQRVRPIELGSSAEFVILRFREFLRTREFGRFPGPTTVRPMQTHARAKNNEATSSASALRDYY